MDNLQVNQKYNMILEREIFSELQIYLCFSNNKIRGRVGAYKVCTSPMKYVTDINFNMLYARIHEKCFHNKELWDRKHVLDATRHESLIYIYIYL